VAVLRAIAHHNVCACFEHLGQVRIYLFILFYFQPSNHITQTPQKLSSERKRGVGAEGVSAWTEDQKRHRGRRYVRHRF